MKDLKIVRIGDSAHRPSVEDLDFWRDKFDTGNYTDDELARDNVRVETFTYNDESSDCLTLIKIGDENHQPTAEELDEWRKVFEEAQNDKDFKVFTHPAVEIETVKTDSVIVFTGPEAIVLEK